MNAPIRHSFLSRPLVAKPLKKAARVTRLLVGKFKKRYAVGGSSPLLDTNPQEPPFCSAALLAEAAAVTSMSDDRYMVTLAQTAADLREAQRLRFEVFRQEFGAEFNTTEPGLDADRFDPYCDHLLVRDQTTQEVVGTYRILVPSQAAELGGYYSESEFDLSALAPLRDSMVELGRSCVHPDHRNGAVIMMLWSGISRYMKFHSYRHLMGCASVSMRDGGRNAKAIWQQLCTKHGDGQARRVVPKHRLPLERIEAAESAVEPPLIKGYVRVGAKVCGEPSWDPDFNTADFLMVLTLEDMTPRYARHFGLTGATE